MYDSSLIPEDIYSPVECRLDGEVRGSCSHYSTRVNITEQIVQMHSFAELQECDETRELSRIVAVASQKLRSEAMLGPTHGHTACAEMKLETYCILEYIARKRFYGYLNSLKEGECLFNAFPCPFF